MTDTCRPLTDRVLRTESIDAGIRRSVYDAAGRLVEGRDEKGAVALSAYDALSRPVRLWARDLTAESVTLRHRLVYGDGADSGLTTPAAAALNLLGRPYLRLSTTYQSSIPDTGIVARS